MRAIIIIGLFLVTSAVSHAQFYMTLLGVGHATGGGIISGGTCVILPGFIQPCGDDPPMPIPESWI